uniref:Coiled-coil domain containing 90B n=1 Tax=Cairina moschata TaxID=8855 RepID=A0A8C3C5K1_CAIMO
MKDLEPWEAPPGGGRLLQHIDYILIVTQTKEACEAWMLLSSAETKGEPVHHDCLETIEATYSSHKLLLMMWKSGSLMGAVTSSAENNMLGFAATLLRNSYDVRRVDITPLEQRRVTFDTHALVQDLEAHGFAKEQAETIVSALITLSNVSLDTVYKDMVTQAQQEITLQQIMAHLDSIRKDMVILEKSEFANLRAENEKMKIELDQVKQQLMNETGKIRADSKLDINLERSRVTDMFTDQERKLMEATTEFHKKDSSTNSVISEISNKIDTEIASLKTLMESNKLDTIRYLAASVFTCLAIALGFYRFWK